MNAKLPLKTRGSILRACLVVLGAACAIGACSIDTHGTGLTPHSAQCSAPTSVQASANPAACTNKYVMKGSCIETETNQTVAQSTYANYTVTGMWDGRQHTAVETLDYSGLKGLNMSNVPGPVKAQEVSNCPTDPWINPAVKCTSGPLQWLEPGEAGKVSVKGPYPITAGHINVNSAVSQLISSVAPPTITVPTENDLILTRAPAETVVTVVARGMLPCGLRSDAVLVSFDAQTRYGHPMGTGPWTEVDIGGYDGHFVNHRATVRIPLRVGVWRIPAFLEPGRAKAGPWRYFRITQGELRMETPRHMQTPRHLVFPAGAIHKP